MYFTGGQIMNRRLATLIIFMLGIAFTSNVQALELNETGKVDIHGFITQGYLVTDNNNFFAKTEDQGTSQFNEVGINFASDVSERLRMGIQFISRDIGKMGNHEVTIDWAVADYSFFDWLNFKAGKIKLPRGIYNTGRDVDMLRTSIFLPQSIYYEGWRDSINTLSGIGIYGYVPLSIVGDLTYDFSGGDIAMKKDGGEARLLEDQVPKTLKLDVLEMNTNITWDTALTLDTVFGIDGLKISGSYLRHEFDSLCSLWDFTVSPTFDLASASVPGHYNYNMTQSVFEVRMGAASGSLEYTYGNTVFAAEYSDTSYDLSLALSPYYPAANKTLARKFHAIGYYGSLTHRFTDWFELGTYYSEYYSDKDDKDAKKAVASGLILAGQEHSKWLKDACLSARFDLTPSWILKLETHVMNGAALLYSDDGNLNAAGTGTNYDEDWMLYAVKLSYSF